MKSTPMHTDTLPIDEVTVLEDRALVVRRGGVELPPGSTTYRIEGVAPALVDKSLSAMVDGTATDVRVLSAKVERRRITEDLQAPGELALLHAQRRELHHLHESVQVEHRCIAAELATLEQAEVRLLEEITGDVAWDRPDVPTWDAHLDRVAARRRELEQSLCACAGTLRRLQQSLEDLETSIAARAAAPTDAATLLLELHNATTASLSVPLRIDYVVPGAVWRPSHTARLVRHDDGATVDLRTEACVWQATGEEWHDVALVFSTERPSLGTAPPSLVTDELRVQRRTPQVHAAARDEAIHTTGPGGAEALRDTLPGIDDGGEALVLRTAGRVSVQADGRPQRFPLFSFSAPAEVDLVCLPELDPAVFLRTRQTHRGTKPILAGPVDLIREGGLAGRTTVLFVAPGERFELGWGPMSELRVTREVHHGEPERRPLSAWTRRPRRVEIRLSNLGTNAHHVEVQERVAVSEIEKVQVEVADSDPAVIPDRDGFVRWTVRLRGSGHKTLSLSWTLVVHDDVVGGLP